MTHQKGTGRAFFSTSGEGEAAATVPALFSLQVQRSGNACALRCGAEELSYEELDARAGRLAAQLAARGDIAGKPVALLLPRSIDLVVGILAVQKAGAWFIPVEPEQPEARIRFLLEDCGAALILSRRSLPAGALAPQDRCIWLDEDSPAAAAVADAPVRPGDVVYAIYTSGSTGQPKGAINFQKGVVNLYEWFAQELGLGAQTRSLVIGSLAFDLYHKAVFAPLLSGGCVVLYEPAIFDPAAVRALIASEAIDLMCATPSAFNALIENAGDAGLLQLSSLKIVSLAGEVMSKKRLRPWLKHPGFAARILNNYGPTECADNQTYHWLAPEEFDTDAPVAIGRAVPGCELYVLDADLKPAPQGEAGRLWLGGVCVGGGYINRPEKTAQVFRPNPFRPGETMYDSGDLARWNAGGELEYHGRADRQVKLSGYRIELDEVEAQLAKLPGVAECAATAPVGPADERVLTVHLRLTAAASGIAQVRRDLAEVLPAYMIPSAWMVLERFPYTTSGKIDRNALPPVGAEPPDMTSPPPPSPALPLEDRIAADWQKLLGTPIEHDVSFMELGGTSVLAVRFVGRIAKELNAAIPMADFFGAPTVDKFAAYLRQRHTAALAQWLGQPQESPAQLRDERRGRSAAAGPVAVVGMACRVPGADNVEVFWQNLVAGHDALTRSERPAGRGADFVAASGWIEDADAFDHEFFRYTPREAAITDPQQRILLECAWHALEHAGIDAARGALEVGVFAGLAANSYLTRNLATHAEFRDYGMDYSSIGNDKDYAATRIAYKLGLRGPAMTLQTACSSSGTALHMACLSLQAGDCDAAIVGGAALPWRYKDGYTHVADGPLSKDGRVRAFDAEASGMVLTGGAACVVLKRLADAEADGDTIYSVIHGSAINNDGGDKAAFTAPSGDGQYAVIRRAMQRARVSAADISYVEAHGTGTPLGDPIELAALTRAYREDTGATGYCGIGSVKGNIGHLDAAAACSGLIKVSLALSHGQLPAQPHFSRPHPECAMERSPFHVNRDTVAWAAREPRLAALSSFGFGGTNFHAVIGQPPAQVPSTPSRRRWHALRLSAKKDGALTAQAEALSGWRRAHPESALADAAWTLDVGRTRLRERAAIVTDDGIDPAMLIRGKTLRAPPLLAWIFPGQGAQHPGMGAQLYREEPVFHAALDHCAEVLLGPLGFDLRTLLYGGAADAGERLRDTAVAQPAIFAISYAMARTWQAWGFEAQAMLGHSIGEFVAATLAGVFELDDALRLVARRGALMSGMPRGSMLAVRMSEDALRACLVPGLDLAAINAPQMCVVSGPDAAVEMFAATLVARNIGSTRLHTSHAFHSAMMQPIVDAFEQEVARCARSRPLKPVMSSLSGEWLGDAQAMDPKYWARQLRQTVRFAPAVQELLKTPGRVLLECGPGQNLAAAMRQCGQAGQEFAVVSSLPPAQAEDADDHRHAVEALARLWIAGVEADPAHYYSAERRNRIALPGYPFARVRHWIEPAAGAEQAGAGVSAIAGSAAPAAGEPDETPVQRQVLAAIGARSGISLQAGDLTRSFIDLGFDSLLLTQLATQLKQEFNTDLRFRQLLRELSTPQLLIDHLQAKAPRPSIAETFSGSADGIRLPARAGARLGRDPEGNPAWFVPDPARAGAYMQLSE